MWNTRYLQKYCWGCRGKQIFLYLEDPYHIFANRFFSHKENLKKHEDIMFKINKQPHSMPHAQLCTCFYWSSFQDLVIKHLTTSVHFSHYNYEWAVYIQMRIHNCDLCWQRCIFHLHEFARYILISLKRAYCYIKDSSRPTQEIFMGYCISSLTAVWLN